mmetsp:Transcript_9771/g.25101  ORF Transcript_9771/g.25101 Transcript_9771/m.25101 type:complete len:233 (+) Transcript_9771:773-1471(+)
MSPPGSLGSEKASFSSSWKVCPGRPPSNDLYLPLTNLARRPSLMIAAACLSPLAMASMPLMWAKNKSSGSRDSLRSLASKFRPPGCKPPWLRITSISRVASAASVKNWSVSQPICGSPVLMSTFPRRPWMLATCSSCSQEWPDRVAWLHSTLTLYLVVRPLLCKKFAVVATSQSYWCFVGSWGFGSIKSVPPKPIDSLYSAAIRMKAPRFSSSLARSVFSSDWYPSLPPQKT